MFELADSARITAGAVLLSATTVASGGWFLTRVVGGKVETTEFQKSFYRAGHAHAGVLIILGLICLLLTEQTSWTGWAEWLSRVGVLMAAILMPAGFFLSDLGAGRTQPNGWISLLWVGAAFLIAGLVTCGLGLIIG